MSSLTEKLKSLGVKVGAGNLPPPRPRDPYPIERIVAGHYHTTPPGEVFVVEKWYPLEHRQGSVSISVTASLRLIGEWAGEPRLAEIDTCAFAFLDTETTGLSGGTGTFAFLVGIGRFEDEGFHLAQFFMRDPAEEPALLAAVTQFLDPCQALVTFNGKAFDVPLLNARYISNAEVPPMTSSAHVDLLPLARRLWRDRLPSRALGYLEQHILGAVRTQEDVPGWLIPNLYFDYLRNGDARPLKSVFYHNAMDVLSLAALLGHMAELIQATHPENQAHATDMVAVAKLHEDLGHLEMAAQLYEHGLNRNLPDEVYWEAIRRLSLLRKRRGDWAAAVPLWQQAAHARQLYACVELAKYHEHTMRDYRQAAEWTETAIAQLETSDLPRAAHRRWLAELEHRLARLRRKLGDS
jgi:uncharacterized protein YprB with RNaseH-like and TPR domain